MNTKVIFLVLGLILGLIMGLLYANSVSKPNSLINNYNRSELMDAHFIEQMIPHHEDAITMSELALTEASRPEIKQLAQNIIDSQSKEIEIMKDWYEDWYAKPLPEGEDIMMHHGMAENSPMHMGMMGDMTDITNLTEAEDFDIAFIEHMIPHHQMAVMMAEMLKVTTDRPEMEKLADDIIKAQSEEITMMREWVREWSN